MEKVVAEAVKFVGLDVSGGPVFDIVVSIPERQTFERPCTERQQAAITQFYDEGTATDLGDAQAHKLLSYREYARSCAEALFAERDHKLARLFTYLIAAYISSQPDISAYAAAHSNARFHAGVENSRARRTKHFPQVEAFCQARLLEMERATSQNVGR